MGDRYLARPEFWAVHIRDFLPDIDMVDASFTDADQTSAVARDVSDPTAWPYFVIPWSGGRLYVVYRNFEGDPGLDYLVEDLAGGYGLTLCELDGSAAGPGLSWDELTAVALDGTDAGSLAWARRFMLLLPMMGDAAAVGHESVVAEALRLVGADGDCDELSAAILAEHALWEPAHWRTTADGVVVCADEPSPRNPGSGRSLGMDDIRWVSRLLHPAG